MEFLENGIIMMTNNITENFYMEHIDDLDYVRFVLFDAKTRKEANSLKKTDGMERCLPKWQV